MVIVEKPRTSNQAFSKILAKIFLYPASPKAETQPTGINRRRIFSSITVPTVDANLHFYLDDYILHNPLYPPVIHPGARNKFALSNISRSAESLNLMASTVAVGVGIAAAAFFVRLPLPLPLRGPHDIP